MDPREPILNPPDPASNSKFLKWLDNVWYHYKWQILIGIFVLFTVTVCIVQCASRENYDTQFVYAGDKILSGEEREVFSQALGEALAQDYDRDGKKTVQLVTFSVFSDGTQPIGSADAERDFTNYLNTGECSIWLVSRYVYESAELSTRAVPLSEIFGSQIPQGAVDDTAVCLQKTAFYRQFAKKSALFSRRMSRFICSSESRLFWEKRRTKSNMSGESNCIFPWSGSRTLDFEDFSGLMLTNIPVYDRIN